MAFEDYDEEQSERQIMLMVSGAIAQLTDLQLAPVDLPCHLSPGEVHHGIWVGDRPERTSNWVGVFRCSGHFWGTTLVRDEVERALAQPSILVGPLVSQQMRGLYEVIDLGAMANGLEPLVMELQEMDYS